MELCHHIIGKLFQINRVHQILITQIDRYGSTAFARVVSTNCPGVHVKHNRAVILLHSTAIAKTQGVAIVLVKGAITSNQLGVNIPNIPCRIQFQNTAQNSILRLNRIPEVIRSFFQIEFLFLKKLLNRVSGNMLYLRYTVT